MTILQLKRGDLLPDLVATVTDPDATFDAVTSWRILLYKGGQPLIVDTAPAVAVSPDTHTVTVTHAWQAGQTDTVGRMVGEVEATWPGGLTQTYPATSYLLIQIGDDLG
ncbi:MAG: hypothetical protein ACRDP1_10495 [Nocardioidaceae bacterium]